MKERDRIIKLVSQLCESNKEFLKKIGKDHKRVSKILNASASNTEKTRELFSPLMIDFNYVGVSDRIADKFLEEHGDITYLQITRKLNKYRKERGRICAKLQNFDSFSDCGYLKGYEEGEETCNNPNMYGKCPLPTHPLRRGGLNRTAYSLYFFLRDLCQGDLISHIDQIIESHVNSPHEEPCSQAVREAGKELIQSFSRVFGVGAKLANMTLADLLMVYKRNPNWPLVGWSLVAVDSLVHNFLHRTGALRVYDCEHGYGGKSCSDKCSQVIYSLAKEIDASEHNPKHPKCFPRFVQHSIWAFCSENGSNICNGNNIDDSGPCGMGEKCPVNEFCVKVPF